MIGTLLLSSLCILAGLFTLWPSGVSEVLRDHTVFILVGLILLGVAAEAALTAIKAAEASRQRATTRTRKGTP
jgi:hypothetical protein